MEKQTVGTALHTVLSFLFPSRQMCVFARPVSRVTLPMTAPLEEVSGIFSNGDGWIDIVVIMMT